MQELKRAGCPDDRVDERGVVGLYLWPPEHAMVFSLDEKSQIQALDRTQPGLPMKKGRAGTYTHDYKGNGTTTWLNMVERFFRDLRQNAIRRGNFTSVPDLIAAIEQYLVHHNCSPKPFVWTATANDILEKVRRAQAALDKRPSV